MQTKKGDAISLLLSVLCTRYVCATQDTHANTTWLAGSGFPPLYGLHGAQNDSPSSAWFGLGRPLINCHGILSLADGCTRRRSSGFQVGGFWPCFYHQQLSRTWQPGGGRLAVWQLVSLERWPGVSDKVDYSISAAPCTNTRHNTLTTLWPRTRTGGYATGATE